MTLSDQQIVDAYEALGVTPEELMEACSNPKDLSSLKHKVKRRYRKLVTLLHPDRTDDERKHELFHAVTAVSQDIADMEAESLMRPQDLSIRFAIKSLELH